MPSIVFCTTRDPDFAISTELFATVAELKASTDIWPIVPAISFIEAEASEIWLACWLDASAKVIALSCVSFAAALTFTVVPLIEETISRNCSTVKLMESAIAPVKSSDTVASAVRSPSAKLPISESKRCIAI